MTTFNTDLVMITWGRIDITELSIRTINKNTTSPYRLIVIDNYSSKEMRDMLTDLKENGLIDKLILLETNSGLEPAKNIGLKEVTSPFFVSTDNDCLPMKPDKDGDWLSKLNKLIFENPDFGAISSRTQVMIGTGNIFDGHEDEDIVEFPWPGGSLRLMNTQAVRDAGGWRDDAPSRGSEERHIGQGLHLLEYKTGFAVKVKCYHLFGSGNWGYGEMLPEEHGHNPVCHPLIQNGDDQNDIKEYV